MITEGRNKNYWDITCSCNLVNPRTSDNTRDKQGTRDKKIPTELRQMSINDKNTTTRAENSEELGGETR